MMLKIENLNFSYGKIQAVRDVSFELKKGEIMAIVGANGAGKSSLMKCIAGLLKPQSGQISLEGEVLEPAARSVDFPKSHSGRKPDAGWIYSQNGCTGD